MNAPRILSRLATTSMRRRPCCATTTAVRSRCSSSSSSRRAYGTPSFQSYPLYPNNNAAPPPPRGDGVPESSIAQTDPLPKVNETRPPPSMSSSLSSSHHASTATRDANASASAATTSTTSETTPATAAPTHAKEAAPATTTNTTTTTTSTATATTTPPPKVSEQEAQKSKPAARPRPKLRARKAAMKLTPAAVEQLRALLDQPEPKLIKVGVRNRGCSGLAYHLEFVEKPGSFDEEVVQDGVKVLIDSKALFSIIGTEMDWVEDKLSQRFVFKNPNIKEQCGCGESFMV